MAASSDVFDIGTLGTWRTEADTLGAPPLNDNVFSGTTSESAGTTTEGARVTNMLRVVGNKLTAIHDKANAQNETMQARVIEIRAALDKTVGKTTETEEALIEVSKKVGELSKDTNVIEVITKVGELSKKFE